MPTFIQGIDTDVEYSGWLIELAFWLLSAFWVQNSHWKHLQQAMENTATLKTSLDLPLFSSNLCLNSPIAMHVLQVPVDMQMLAVFFLHNARAPSDQLWRLYRKENGCTNIMSNSSYIPVEFFLSCFTPLQWACLKRLKGVDNVGMGHTLVVIFIRNLFSNMKSYPSITLYLSVCLLGLQLTVIYNWIYQYLLGKSPKLRYSDSKTWH